jgi:hypothetical protein
MSVQVPDSRIHKRILAIDPGQSVSAFAMLSGGDIIAHGLRRNSDVLSLVKQESFDVLVLEMIASYGLKVGKSVFETCVFIGELKATVESRGLPVRLVFRKDVKKHICGTCLSKDSDVRRKMLERYGDPGSKSQPGATFGITQDVWQALALATTVHDDAL